MGIPTGLTSKEGGGILAMWVCLPDPREGSAPAEVAKAHQVSTGTHTPSHSGEQAVGAAHRRRISTGRCTDLFPPVVSCRWRVRFGTMMGSTGQIPATAQMLDEERRRLFTLLDELPAIVYLRAPDYSIAFANRHFRRRFGDPSAGPCYRVIHDRSVPCEPCGCATALAGGELLESEWAFADGTTYQLYDYPFVDVDGIEKVLHLGIDITKRRQAEAELERANRELLALSQAEHRERLLAEDLAQAALALNSSLDLAQVLDRILEQTLRLLPCPAATVLLVEGGQIQMVRQCGLEAWAAPVLEDLEAGVPLDGFPRLQAACHERLPLLIQEATQDAQARPLSDLGWVHSLAFLPMIQGQSVVGFVSLLSDRPGFFTPERILHLQSFASHAALAIENARLYRGMKESREQLQSLSRRLVEIQENERRHVARELHDEAGQALTSLVIQLKLLQRDANAPPRMRAGISVLMAEVELLMENLHRLAMDLRPASLDHVGLTAALQQYCRTLAEQNGLRVGFETVGLEGRVAPDVETALYRIVQEALHNVVRHARAARVDVLLERRGDRIVAIVEDNGQGFDVTAAAGPGHLGLLGIQERALALGGSLTIESTPCGGTALFVEVPDARPGSDCG